MAYIIKGFFLGIFFVIVFTLILAPMLQNVIAESSKSECNYNCSFQKLLEGYNSPLFLILFGAFWILGTKISKLSYLIQKKEEIINMSTKKSQKEFKWPWEHKLRVVEDLDEASN